MNPYYDDGQIQIWCADCRDILPMIEPSGVDLVLTDPPYGFGQSDQRRHQRAKNDPGRDSALPVVDGDAQPFDPATVLLFRRVVLFGANHYADQLPPSRSWLVWDKRNGSTPDDNADAELIWTNIPGVVRIYRQCWRGFTREFDQNEPKEHIHPTQKPVALMSWILERLSKPGDLILDPYMGSGPVARACADLQRRYIGIELKERYCAAAVKRLQQQVLPLVTTT